MNGELHAAVAAGLVSAEESHAALLQSIVEVAMAIFRAAASSIFLFDEAEGELVFEAVAGEGSEWLVGRRYSSDTGIAGWVLTTRQPVVLEDVRRDPRFARGILVDVPWKDGGEMRVSGNSFATPHVAGLAALVLGKHQRLTPFQLKTVLYLTASNVT